MRLWRILASGFVLLLTDKCCRTGTVLGGMSLVGSTEETASEGTSAREKKFRGSGRLLYSPGRNMIPTPCFAPRL